MWLPIFGFVHGLLDILTIRMGKKRIHQIFIMNTFYLNVYNLIEKLYIETLILSRAFYFVQGLLLLILIHLLRQGDVVRCINILKMIDMILFTVILEMFLRRLLGKTTSLCWLWKRWRSIPPDWRNNLNLQISLLVLNNVSILFCTI